MASLALPLLTTGISALAGLFGAKPKPIVTNSSSNSTSTSTPNLNPNQQTLENEFTQNIQKQLNSANDMSGYEGQGLQQINQNAGIGDKMSQNILAARGLSNSPYAATQVTMNNNNRLNQQSQFINQIPLLQTQLRQNAIQQAIQGSTAIPYGSTTTGSQSGTSTQTGGGGSPIAGALSGAGAALNAPMGGGVSAGQQIANSLGNIFGSKGPQATGPSYYDPSEA